MVCYHNMVFMCEYIAMSEYIALCVVCRCLLIVWKAMFEATHFIAIISM